MSDQQGIIDTIVSTLLHVGGRVFEVSKDLVMTNMWARNQSTATQYREKYVGKLAADTPSSNIFLSYADLIENCFRTGNDYYVEHVVAETGDVYGIRLVNCHPDKSFIFVVVEDLSKKETKDAAEEKWKLVLDACGDGMWDLNMETNRIYFSEKWHEVFGFGATDITTLDEWYSRVHPEDLINTQKVLGEYLAGNTPSYLVEMRYKTKGGVYKWLLSRGVAIARGAAGEPLRFIGTHTDINERKKAEEKYFEVAQLLSKLINNLQNGILVTDEHRTIVFANQMFCDMLSIPGTPDKLIGVSMDTSMQLRKSLYNEPEEFIRKTEIILKKQEVKVNEEWGLADGRTFSRDYIPLSLGTNNKGGIWKFRDITDQKNADQRLEKQRMFYEQILNSIAADIVVFDAQQRYLFANPAALKSAELRRWIIGKTDRDYCVFRDKPLAIAERREEIFSKARDERKSVEWEEKLVQVGGVTEYHLRNMYPVFNDHGDLEMAIGYGLNITDRVLAQEALKTSIDTFASAFDYSGIGMALISPEGAWLDVNTVLCKLTGYTKGELMKLSYHDITYPDDIEIDRPLINRLLKKEISTYSIEKRYVSKKNKIVLVLLTVSVVWINDDIPKFFIAQVVDITEKKELENEINKKNTELERTRDNLVNKISQLEEVSYIIAHNLRGPAGNIKMLTDALIAQNSDGAKANALSGAFTTDEALDLIQESSVSLMESLATLMAITEIKLNKEIPYDDCDVAGIVGDITTQLHSIIYEKRAVIKLDLGVKQIRYPKAYLENILYNLVSNALKYSRHQLPPEITVTTRNCGDKVQLIVKDNGLGIDLEKYGHLVFKLNHVFHQGHDSKGVGLYITKTQIESFGGTIELNSILNEGCEFIVTF